MSLAHNSPPTTSESLGLDFPNLPYYIDGELRLTQSHAILLHVAREAGMDGSTPATAAAALMLLELSREVRDPYVRLAYSPLAVFEAKRADFVDSLAQPLARLEAFASKSSAFLCNELTFVDLVWTDLLEQLVVLAPALLDSCPRLQALVAAVNGLPKMAAYRASPSFIDRPFNNAAAAFRG